MKKTIVTGLFTISLFLLCHTVMAQPNPFPYRDYQSDHGSRHLYEGIETLCCATSGHVKERAYLNLDMPDAPIVFAEISVWVEDSEYNIIEVGYASGSGAGSANISVTCEYPTNIRTLHYYWWITYADGTYETINLDYWE